MQNKLQITLQDVALSIVLDKRVRDKAGNPEKMHRCAARRGSTLRHASSVATTGDAP